MSKKEVPVEGMIGRAVMATRHNGVYTQKRKGKLKPKKTQAKRQAGRNRARFLLDNAARYKTVQVHNWDMTGEKPRLIPAVTEKVRTFQGKQVTGKRFDANRFVDDDMELRAMPYTSRLAAEVRQEGTIREHRNGDSAFDKRLFKRTEKLRNAYQGTIGFAFHKAAFA